MNIRAIRLMICALALGLFGRPLAGQGSDLGTIRGAVVDPSGAMVIGAGVEIVDVATR